MSGRTPVDLMLDGVEWTILPPSERSTESELPFATMEGVLHICGFAMRAYQLNDGTRLLDADDVARFFGQGLLEDERVGERRGPLAGETPLTQWEPKGVDDHIAAGATGDGADSDAPAPESSGAETGEAVRGYVFSRANHYATHALQKSRA